MLCRRDLDEAQPSEQENSLNSKQGVTNAMGGAGIKQERIEQRAIVPACWFHHIGGVHQRGYQKSRLARRGVVLIERFLNVG